MPALCALIACSTGEKPPPLPFTDMALAMGLTKAHTGGGPDKGYIVEAKGGGAAWADFDSDGDLDIYWVNGATLEDPAGGGNALYRNDGEQGFTDVAQALGAGGRGWGMGAIAADYDADGDQDLYITCLKKNILYRNDGRRGFTDIAAQSGVEDARWSTGAAFADYDLDGDLDLYVAHYAEFDRDAIKHLGTQWKGVDVFVGPLGLIPIADVLYQNAGDGTFRDATAETITQEPGYGFAVLFADYDLDGDMDLYVANDSSPNFLFRNEGGTHFTDLALSAQVAYGETGIAQAGMGAALGDYDQDGHPDLFVTNFEDDYNALYQSRGDGRFSDQSFAAGLGRIALPFVGFGANFLDYDLDADLDLFVANGHVYPAIEKSGATYAQSDQLFANDGQGHFTLAWSAPPRLSRGSFAADYDDDGDPDLLVCVLNDKPALLRNEKQSGRHWLGVKLAGRTPNLDAIGARIELFIGGKMQMRQVLCGSSFLGSEDKRLLFGLGDAPRADSLRIYWPSGATQLLRDLPVDTYLTIGETAP